MGREKIYDIRPKPAKRAKDLTGENKPFFEKNKGLGLAKNRVGKKKNSKGNELNLKAGNFLKTKKYWLLLLGALLIALIVVFQLSAKAEIEIRLFERSLSFQKQVLIDAKTDKSRFSNSVIMGRKIIQTDELTKKFSATGSAIEETKAEGKVMVINNYHLAQVLVKKTRFLSADGKLFYLKEDISVPPGASLEAEVEAAELGPDYNIKPTTFSIPGLLGSPRYTFVYAESSSPMGGGEQKTVAQITKADLDRAEKETGQELFLLLEKKLGEQASSAFSLLSGTVESQILEKTFSQEAGDKKTDFNCFLKMETEGIAFQKQDFDELIEYFISEEIDENEEIKSATVSAIPEIKDFDLSDDKAYLDVKVSVVILKSIDVDGLKRALSGKPIKESKMFLVSDSAIEEVELKIFPFWLLNIPQNLERININFDSD